jgi:hypothetical protein
MSPIIYIQMSALSSNFPKSVIMPQDKDRRPGHLSPRELCITAEKWFASGESNVFRLSSDEVNGLS